MEKHLSYRTGFFILSLVTIAVLWFTFLTYRDHSGLDKVESIITEDMPGWDCSTMGNKVCGGE